MKFNFFTKKKEKKMLRFEYKGYQRLAFAIIGFLLFVVTTFLLGPH